MAEKTQAQKDSFGFILTGIVFVGVATLVMGPFGLIVSVPAYLAFHHFVQKSDGH